MVAKGKYIWSLSWSFYLTFWEKSETLSFTSFSLLAFVLNFSIVNCWSAAAFSYLKIESCLVNIKGVDWQIVFTNILSLYLVLGGANNALAARAKLYSRWVERSTLAKERKLQDLIHSFLFDEFLPWWLAVSRFSQILSFESIPPGCNPNMIYF